MNEFKGTPGPWFWESDILCNVDFIVGGKYYQFNDRNRDLIATAPELLESLQAMVSAIKITLRVGHERIIELGGDCDSPEVMIKGHSEIARAEAVIARALGQ